MARPVDPGATPPLRALFEKFTGKMQEMGLGEGTVIVALRFGASDPASAEAFRSAASEALGDELTHRKPGRAVYGFSSVAPVG